MTLKMPFLYSTPLPAAELPLTLISLEEWAIVVLYGRDAAKYLQSQITCDINDLRKNNHLIAAHCDEKGKMFSAIHVFYHHNGIGLIERRSILDTQLLAMKKYAVFSKITFSVDDENILLGIAGKGAKEAIRGFFTTLPDEQRSVVQTSETTLIYYKFPESRFLLVTTKVEYIRLIKYFECHAQTNNSQQWLSLDIQAGYPIIDRATTMRFFPQATNIQELGGISFDKGCYIGQESIARRQYRGTNKQALYWLSGTANHVPIAGSNMELQMHNDWVCTGTVLAASKISGDIVWVQAVLSRNNVSTSSKFRLCNDLSSRLTIQVLPYTNKS